MEHDPLIVSLKPKRPYVADEAQEPRKKRRAIPYLIGLILLSVVAGAAYAGYLYLSRMNAITSNAATLSDAERSAEVADTIARVSELIVLPEGEDPTVATVTDPEKLRDQPFFDNAKAGYRVLLYTKARKAYLYDPEAHRLIEVAPISTEVQ